MQHSSSQILIEDKQKVPKEFNKVADRYDFATSMSQGYQEDLNRSGKLLELKGDELVIDLCCGTGKSTLSFLDKITSGKIICVDNSEGMLEVAKLKFSKEIEEGKIELSLQDAMHLNFAENSVDAIFMAYGLRNMPNYEKLIRDLYRILKPNGQLVIHDYSLKDAWYVKPLWKILGYGFIVPFCTIVSGSASIYTYLIKSVSGFLNPAEIKSLLEDNGFENVTVHHHPSWRRLFFHSFRAVKK
ncbi:MAG TPA: class I SAM-dependent methyltransferase [Chitinophagales bacterium]|nr:class I SAM-dependent methyltransferase [Chitinophagales bacterium]